jgi:hypothetical protein
MKKLDQLINPALNQIQNTSQPVQPSAGVALNHEARELVNKLFDSLKAAKPASSSAYPDEQSWRNGKIAYVRALIENEVTDQRLIALGIKRARKDLSPFFPSTGQFVAWCQPQSVDVGLPEAAHAFFMVCSGAHSPHQMKWPHGALYELGRRLGWSELHQGKVSEKAFKEEYQRIIKEVFFGQTFEVPAKNSSMIEYQEGKKTRTIQQKKVGNESLAKLKNKFR